MKRKGIRPPSPAMVVAIIALIVGLGSGAYAAKIKLGKNVVKTKNIKNEAVTEAKIAKGAVTESRLAASVRGQAQAWAEVAPSGAVTRSRGLTASNITHQGNGFYCFPNVPAFGSISLTPAFTNDEFGSFAIATLSNPVSADIGCPAGTQFAVVTQFFNIVADTAPFTNEGFTIVLNQ
jgi:hypothetical protein